MYDAPRASGRIGFGVTATPQWRTPAPYKDIRFVLFPACETGPPAPVAPTACAGGDVRTRAAPPLTQYKSNRKRGDALIELTRALARSFRTVLRRSLLEQGPQQCWPPVVCEAGDGGLTLQARHIDLVLRFHQPGKRPTDLLAVRADLLAEFEGRTDAPVALERLAGGKGRARWDEGGAPCAVEFDAATPEQAPKFPDAPARWAPMPPEFLRALDEAPRTAARESVRYALSRIQLRGRRGEVVGTDGGQLLVQGGFAFPWPDDLLIPRVSAFGCRDFADAGEVRVGRARDHVAVSVGPWALLLAVDATGCYPDTQAVIPRTAGVLSRLVLDERDAASLTAALPKLPGAGDCNAPITLELDRPPAVRVRADGSGQATEVPLARSASSGPVARVCVNRRLLHRALTLGFREVQVMSPEAPLVCRDGRRTYVWMPLDKKGAVAPDAGAIRIGPGEPLAPAPSLNPPDKEIIPMPPPPTDGRAPEDARPRDPQPEKGDLEDVIAETESLRSLLQDAAVRTARLLAALKYQRRQSRAVKAAMQSLQQLRLGP